MHHIRTAYMHILLLEKHWRCEDFKQSKILRPLHILTSMLKSLARVTNTDYSNMQRCGGFYCCSKSTFCRIY